MVPPPFPLLLVFPALAIDLILRKMDGLAQGWRRVRLSVILGAAFVAVFAAVQWPFSSFLLSPAADNWVFAGNRYWGYESNPGEWAHRFWEVSRDLPNYRPFGGRAIVFSWAIAAMGAWIGLLWGGWMRKVQR